MARGVVAEAGGKVGVTGSGYVAVLSSMNKDGRRVRADPAGGLGGERRPSPK